MEHDQAEFEQHVADALTHYCESTRLEMSPLLDYLLPPAQLPQDRIASLRKLLRDSIEQLRPPQSVPMDQPEWLDYRLLWSRAIQRQSPHRICDDLGLSRATFYRRQREAVQAVARILWDGRRRESPQTAGSPASGVSVEGEAAVGAAVQLANEAQKGAVDLREVLQDVQRVASPLLDRQGIALDIVVRGSLPPVYGDPTVVRQILLNILTGATQLGAVSALCLEISAAAGMTLWCLSGLGACTGDGELTALTEFAISGNLLAIYGGSLSSANEGESIVIRFSLPAAESQRVLIVDDDEDVTRLYQTHLRRHGYSCAVARSGEELWHVIERDMPQLILLDVLMPKEDGWLILQRLQTLPETAHIPVVVCSVLNQPPLALALGARLVLEKPIGESDLLAAVQHVLSEGDTRGRLRP